MTRLKLTLLAAGLGACIAAALAGTYLHTREKWYALGRIAGMTDGLAAAMEVVCSQKTEGPAEAEPDASFAVKADLVTLTRKGDLVEIRCTQ